MDQLLVDLGVNIAAGAIWDIVKNITKNPTTKSDLETKLTEELGKSQLDLQGVEMKSQEIINFLIDNGALKFNDTLIYSDTSIVQRTEGNGIVVSKNSKFTTPNTVINVQGNNSIMQQQGNVVIEQGVSGISITVRGNKNDKPGDNSFNIEVKT